MDQLNRRKKYREYWKNHNPYTEAYLGRLYKKCGISIDRKNNNQDYQLPNMCLACKLCNRLKSDFFTEKEFKEIAIKYIKPKYENTQ